MGRPPIQLKDARIETVNDKDGFISNFWRAVKADPDAVVEHADWPILENDHHARHAWLVHKAKKLTRRLEGDPEYYDAKIAGWWVWGISMWIGGGYCSGSGAWVRQKDSKGYWELVKSKDENRKGVTKSMPTTTGGKGVHRDALIKDVQREEDIGIRRKLPKSCMNGIFSGDKRSSGESESLGIVKPLPQFWGAGVHLQEMRNELGINKPMPKTWMSGVRQRDLRNEEDQDQEDIPGVCSDEERNQLILMFRQLSRRLRYVRVCSGDWERVLGTGSTLHSGTAGIFLDPPYHADDDWSGGAYREEDATVAQRVRQWAIENGDNKLFRIAYCCYDHFDMPEGWTAYRWKASGGYGNQGKKDKNKGKKNSHREVVWFSPHCIGFKKIKSGVAEAFQQTENKKLMKG